MDEVQPAVLSNLEEFEMLSFAEPVTSHRQGVVGRPLYKDRCQSENIDAEFWTEHGLGFWNKEGK